MSDDRTFIPKERIPFVGGRMTIADFQRWQRENLDDQIQQIQEWIAGRIRLVAAMDECRCDLGTDYCPVHSSGKAN
jgi:hypothetical protein